MNRSGRAQVYPNCPDCALALAYERDRLQKWPLPGGSFDPQDFAATSRWIAGQYVAIREAEKQNNDLTMKEAKLRMLHTLSSIEGKHVEWQMSVASVSETHVFLNDICLFTIDKKDQPEHLSIYVGRFAIGEAITFDQARRLKAGDRVAISGKVGRCFAEKGQPGFRWRFYIDISDGKIK